MTQRAWHRSLAVRLLRHARHMLPPARAGWADALQHETEHVQGDWQALRWASGCVFAAYRERWGAMHLTELGTTRFLMVSIFAVMALRDFFATALTVAYRTDALGLATWLGHMTAGDDFRRLIPLMDGVPMWLHAMWVCGGVLYLTGIADIALRKHRAHALVVTAVAVDLMAEILSRPIVAAIGVAVAPHRSVVVEAVPYLLPLTLALMLWLGNRHWRGPKMVPS